MANYANSLLVTAQALLSQRMAAPEMRHKDYNLTGLLKNNAPALLPDLESLKTSDQRPVEAYCFTKSASDAVSARASSHTAAAFGDTQKVTLSFTTYGQLFKASLKMADRNFMAAAAMLSNRIESAWIQLLDDIETAQATYLNTNKTHVQAASDGTLGTWDGVNYEWTIALADQNWYYQYMLAMMKINNYGGMLDIVCDPVSFAIAQQLANQGGSNATNTQFQFAGANLLLSTDLAPNASYKGYNYALTPGTVAILPWIPPENRIGKETRLQTYSQMADPFGLGLTAALHIYETKADTSATVGETQDEVVEYELTVDIASVKAPLSTSNETVIHKIGLLAT